MLQLAFGSLPSFQLWKMSASFFFCLHFLCSRIKPKEFPSDSCAPDEKFINFSLVAFTHSSPWQNKKLTERSFFSHFFRLQNCIENINWIKPEKLLHLAAKCENNDDTSRKHFASSWCLKYNSELLLESNMITIRKGNDANNLWVKGNGIEDDNDRLFEMMWSIGSRLMNKAL